jgi:hypothetical protein
MVFRTIAVLWPKTCFKTLLVVQILELPGFESHKKINSLYLRNFFFFLLSKFSNAVCIVLRSQYFVKLKQQRKFRESMKISFDYLFVFSCWHAKSLHVIQQKKRGKFRESMKICEGLCMWFKAGQPKITLWTAFKKIIKISSFWDFSFGIPKKNPSAIISKFNMREFIHLLSNRWPNKSTFFSLLIIKKINK